MAAVLGIGAAAMELTPWELATQYKERKRWEYEKVYLSARLPLLKSFPTWDEFLIGAKKPLSEEDKQERIEGLEKSFKRKFKKSR
jgi:hypothetical protein